MIIYFEGNSCAGKTYLIDKIRENPQQKIHCINELPIDYRTIKDPDNFCRNNDERKCFEALKNSNKSIVLVDRGYLSTLAYNYIQYKMGLSKEYLKSINWYCKNITTKKLIKPDLYVYLYLDKKTAISRAKNLNRFSKSIAWYSEPEIGNQYCKTFFNLLEPEVPLLWLNSKDNVEKMVAAFWKIVNTINEI